MTHRGVRDPSHIPFDAAVHPTVRIRQTTFVDIRPVSRICSGGYECPATLHIHGCFADFPCTHEEVA
jgi:hypothetical protein